jgi:RNA polymerase sigma-70 factor (ECF subfamily)
MTHQTQDLDMLLRTAQPGDPTAGEALVSGYYAQLYRLAFSVLGDELDADDVAQESLLHALENLQRYRPGSSLKNWLYTICINLSRDALRRQASRQRVNQTLYHLGMSDSPDSSPEEVYLQDEKLRDLRRAVQSLDEDHRLPLILRYVHGMTAAEIARALGLREGTVHSRLHYAVRKLQAQLVHR